VLSFFKRRQLKNDVDHSFNREEVKKRKEKKKKKVYLLQIVFCLIDGIVVLAHDDKVEVTSSHRRTGLVQVSKSAEDSRTEGVWVTHKENNNVVLPFEGGDVGLAWEKVS